IRRGQARGRRVLEAPWSDRHENGPSRRCPGWHGLPGLARAGASESGTQKDPQASGGNPDGSCRRRSGAPKERDHPPGERDQRKGIRSFMTKIQTPRSIPLGIEEKYEEVRQLISIGRQRGYLVYDEVNDILPEEVSTSVDEIEELYERLASHGIELVDSE